jgi:hypothetical protein
VPGSENDGRRQRGELRVDYHPHQSAFLKTLRAYRYHSQRHSKPSDRDPLGAAAQSKQWADQRDPETPSGFYRAGNS